MNRPTPQQTALAVTALAAERPVAEGVLRIKSKDLFQQLREVEIDHDGRIYRLRLTQLNKLILTA
jgi:hemin uptake protein HemP